MAFIEAMYCDGTSGEPVIHRIRGFEASLLADVVACCCLWIKQRARDRAADQQGSSACPVASTKHIELTEGCIRQVLARLCEVCQLIVCQLTVHLSCQQGSASCTFSTFEYNIRKANKCALGGFAVKSVSSVCMLAGKHGTESAVVPDLKVPGLLACKCSSSMWSTSSAADWVACCLDLD